MHEPSEEVDKVAQQVVDAALAVHRELGPGYLEAAYEQAFCFELGDRGISFQQQVPVELRYLGRTVGAYRLDVLVSGLVVVEIKAVEVLAPVHAVQVRSYLKATGLDVGLLINFNARLLKEGLRRIIYTDHLRHPAERA